MKSTERPRQHFLSKDKTVVLGICCISILIVIGIWLWYVDKIDTLEKNLKKHQNTELLHNEN